MNKYKESLERLQTCMDGNTHYDRYTDGKIMFNEDIKTMWELVEKETPKPPEKTKTNLRGILFDSYLCPECGNMVKDEKYCPKCGQRIDWGEEND